MSDKCAMDFFVMNKKVSVSVRRRRTPARLCLDTYRPLLGAMAWGTRLLQIILAPAAIYIPFYYNGRPVKLAGIICLLALIGSIPADKAAGCCRMQGVTVGPLQGIVFAATLVAASLPSSFYLPTSGNTTPDAAELLSLCTSAAAMLPAAVVMLTLWWALFVILYSNKYLEQAARLNDTL